MSWFGGIYRHPPAPQQSRPSGTLPEEVFPNPPVGNRGRNIVMAIVATQWIGSPQPQQRLPVVTEEAVAVVEFIPASRSQDQVVYSSWRGVLGPQQLYPKATEGTPHIPRTEKEYLQVIGASWLEDPSPQRARPTAILPAEVFDNPPLGVHDSQNSRIVDGWWRPDSQPQQQYPSITEEEVVVAAFVPFTRDRIASSLWAPVHVQPPLRPVVTEGAVVEVFVPFTRERIAAGLWDVTQIPQRSVPSVIIPVVAVVDDPVGQYPRKVIDALVVAQWIWVPEPTQRPPVVTESGAPVVITFVPFTRDQVAESLWIPAPTPSFIVQRYLSATSVIPPALQITGGFLGRSFMS